MAVPFGWTASTAGVDAAAHAALTTGYHGTGTAQVATTANIATHAALTSGVHGLPNPLTVAMTAQVDKTADTALANVLSLNLAGTSSYLFTAVLFVDATAIGGHKYSVDGTVTGTIKYQVNSVDDASNLNVITQRQTALAATIGQAGASTIWTQITGAMTTAVAGTINIQFAQQAASGTSSVLTQSWFQAVKIG